MEQRYQQCKQREFEEHDHTNEVYNICIDRECSRRICDLCIDENLHSECKKKNLEDIYKKTCSIHQHELIEICLSLDCQQNQEFCQGCVEQRKHWQCEQTIKIPSKQKPMRCGIHPGNNITELCTELQCKEKVPQKRQFCENCEQHDYHKDCQVEKKKNIVVCGIENSKSPLESVYLHTLKKYPDPPKITPQKLDQIKKEARKIHVKQNNNNKFLEEQIQQIETQFQTFEEWMNACLQQEKKKLLAYVKQVKQSEQNMNQEFTNQFNEALDIKSLQKVFNQAGPENVEDKLQYQLIYKPFCDSLVKLEKIYDRNFRNNLNLQINTSEINFQKQLIRTNIDFFADEILDFDLQIKMKKISLVPNFPDQKTSIVKSKIYFNHDDNSSKGFNYIKTEKISETQTQMNAYFRAAFSLGEKTNIKDLSIKVGLIWESQFDSFNQQNQNLPESQIVDILLNHKEVKVDKSQKNDGQIQNPWTYVEDDEEEEAEDDDEQQQYNQGGNLAYFQKVVQRNKYVNVLIKLLPITQLYSIEIYGDSLKSLLFSTTVKNPKEQQQGLHLIIGTNKSLIMQIDKISTFLRS